MTATDHAPPYLLLAGLGGLLLMIGLGWLALCAAGEEHNTGGALLTAGVGVHLLLMRHLYRLLRR